MASIIHPLFALLASVARQQLLQQITYLLFENRMRRRKLPDRLSLSNQELGPEPHDHPNSWSEFLKRHAETLWQCDFASKRKWTISGMIDVYFLVFIHLGSIPIWISPCTEHPTAEWTSQQAQNFQMHVDNKGLKCEKPPTSTKGRMLQQSLNPAYPHVTNPNRT